MFKEPKFWLVWCPTGSNPSFRHVSIESATREAERLANENPYRTFIVLEGICARRTQKMVSVEFLNPTDNIPF